MAEKEGNGAEESAEEQRKRLAKLPDGWRLNDDLSHGHMEDYYAALNGLESTGSVAEEFGNTLRAAIAAGWFLKPDGLTPEQVRGMGFRAVRGAAFAVWQHINVLATDDPN